MRFLPQTETEIEQMLKVVGAGSIDDLIAHVPAQLRRSASIKLAPGMSEAQVAGRMQTLAARNSGALNFRSFLGGGYYRHYVPAAVRAILARSEFATSYTPYQPEASQGTLQAIFEFQTLIAQLTALEVANASMYDGASAAAEAVLMARRILPRRGVVALSRALWPDYRLAIRTYLSAFDDIRVVEVPFDKASGAIALEQVRAMAGDRLLCTVAGYPNMFGIVEPLAALSELAHHAGALSISATAEPLALGLLKPPGELGVDIAVGEGQSFGLPPQFGGPGVGFFAGRMAHVRQMPGRLVGETRDREGRRAFCLTLATREQHIRRERATSNICTNHSLCALAVTVYLSLLGASGLRELAEHNLEIAHYAADRLASAGIRSRFSGPFFNEFVVEVNDATAVVQVAERAGVLAGLPLSSDYPELDRAILICATEMNQPADVDLLCEALQEEV
jgi:glycine dehydrogenase subunit 1